MCMSVCAFAFGDKDPCCGESCGKGVRPEDVSAPASDNVSWKDTACHFTQAHIKKDSGGREEKTACHLFALIQDHIKGVTGRIWKCASLWVCGTFYSAFVLHEQRKGVTSNSRWCRCSVRVCIILIHWQRVYFIFLNCKGQWHRTISICRWSYRIQTVYNNDIKAVVVIVGRILNTAPS